MRLRSHVQRSRPLSSADAMRLELLPCHDIIDYTLNNLKYQEPWFRMDNIFIRRPLAPCPAGSSGVRGPFRDRPASRPNNKYNKQIKY